MATAPIFFATPFAAQAQISAANTNLDGSGTVVDLFAVQAAALKVERINVKAIVTTTAGMIRIFAHDGTNTRLIRELAVDAITKSATVAAFSASLDFTRPEDLLVLPVGWQLKASTEKAEAFNLATIGALA